VTVADVDAQLAALRGRLRGLVQNALTRAAATEDRDDREAAVLSALDAQAQLQAIEALVGLVASARAQGGFR
jgi:hypothetical protein